jgi:uncharacterized protein YjbI with pentapeptide repeats
MMKRLIAKILRKLHSSWFYWVIAGFILAILIAWVSHWGIQVSQNWANLQRDPTDATKRKFDASLEIAKAIVGGAGTIATICGGIILYFNFRVANQNVKIANQNVELTESRLITERFSKAVEQLGSDKLEVRLGGIYALERIAYDSDRDHWTIMEILTSFIQEKSSIKQLTQEKISAKAYEMSEKGNVDTTDEQNWESAVRELAYELTTKDIHAAFTVICRRQEKDPPGRSLVLNGAILSGTDLHADLPTDPRSIDLRGADLSGTYLIGANLSLVNLSGAVLRGTNLNGAILVGAHLIGANLIDENLNKAILSTADLSRALLWNANLSYAGLRHTNLSNAQLDGADLSYAELHDANLTSATLINAKFIATQFIGANLSGANHLTVEQLTTAKLCKTILPEKIALNLKNQDCKELGIPEN